MSSQYFFTQNWFEPNKSVWEGMLCDFENRKLAILEIGSHEGGSTTFILDKYMNHPDSVLHCIDPFLTDDTTSPVQDQTYDIFYRNISQSHNSHKLVLFRDKSKNVLPQLSRAGRMYDLIYVDGSHIPADIMGDALFASELLAPNGCLIFDDYGSPTNNFEIRRTINSFINLLNPQEWRIAGSWYQMFLRKSYNSRRTDIWDLQF